MLDRETLEAIHVLGIWRVLYGRLIYRHHMRIIHRFDKHRLQTRPIDGAKGCSWCGHLVAADGAIITDGPAMMKRIRALSAEAKRTGKLTIPTPESEVRG